MELAKKVEAQKAKLARPPEPSKKESLAANKPSQTTTTPVVVQRTKLKLEAKSKLTDAEKEKAARRLAVFNFIEKIGVHNLPSLRKEAIQAGYPARIEGVMKYHDDCQKRLRDSSKAAAPTQSNDNSAATELEEAPAAPISEPIAE